MPNGLTTTHQPLVARRQVSLVRRKKRTGSATSRIRSQIGSPSVAVPVPFFGMRLVLRVAGMALLCVLSGCAALTNPVANGVPVRMLPPEMLAEPKEQKETIPLVYLRRPPPERYLLGPGDVLGVFVEGILGKKDEPPPVTVSEDPTQPAAIGYPIPVRQDGTISLPLIKPLKVADMAVEDAERLIIQAYTTGPAPILEPGRMRILVTLLSPRRVQVLVIRQDAPNDQFVLRARGRGGVLERTVDVLGGAEEIVGGRRRGTGIVVNLPAYQNDVLHALTYSGGLPGLDAANEVVIQRGHMSACMPTEIRPGEQFPTDLPPAMMGGPGSEIVRIPLRVGACEPLPFRPEDVVLHSGDVIFIEARNTEVFYAGGLLPAGEYPLPRDYDLDVVEAIASIGGILVSGGIATSNLDGRVVAAGIGNPSPKLLTVLRRVPGRGQVPIRVDLNKALRDPRESLIIEPGDILILQESKEQAIVRYFTDIFNLSVFSNVINRGDATGTASVVVP